MLYVLFMTLDHWLNSNNLNAEEFARRLSADGQSLTGEAVRKWRKGERMPEAEIVERIVRETGGAVTVQDLHNARVEFLKKDLPGLDELRQAGAA